MVGPVHLLTVNHNRTRWRAQILRHDDLLDVDHVERLRREASPKIRGQGRAPEMRGGIRGTLRGFGVVLGRARAGWQVDVEGCAEGFKMLPRARRAGIFGKTDGEYLDGGKARERANQAEVSMMPTVDRRVGDVWAEKECPHPPLTRVRISSSERPFAAVPARGTKPMAASARPWSTTRRSSKRDEATQAPRLAARRRGL